MNGYGSITKALEGVVSDQVYPLSAAGIDERLHSLASSGMR